jgi:phosphatidate cytidylyltransferase
VALKREIAAAIAIPLVLAVLFFAPPVVFDGLVGAIALAALWEFYRLAEKTGHPVAKTIGMAGGVLVFFASGFLGVFERSDFRVIVILGGVAVLAAVGQIASSVDVSSVLGGTGSTVLGLVLITIPALAMCLLRDFSPRAVLFLFLIVWGCDSFAYYTGKNFGRRKLAPVVSPNKTWEGTIGGLVGATLIGAAAGAWWVLPELGPARGALAGALASSAGQIGDLVESLWKRGAGVKDSGVFLPGHGGFYDRIDSLLFAGPILAAFVHALR